MYDAGLDATKADLIIGTSAGSTAAAQITGASPAELLAATLAPPPSRAAATSPHRGPPPSGPAANRIHTQRLGAIIASATDLADLRRKLGAAALKMEAASDGSWSAQWRTVVASRLPGRDWPQQAVQITAVDARTGEPVVFDRGSGIDLVDAVAASCSSGLPYKTGGNHYIDGGFRLGAENADLAAGYDRVLILAPFSGRSLLPPRWGVQLSAQIDALRAGGSKVEAIFPDDSTRHIFVPDGNVMDPATRQPAARSGYNQGRDLAARLASFWR